LIDSVRRVLSPEYRCKDEVKLPQDFTAFGLKRVGDIQTSNLAEHLLMKDDDTKVTIFHQASFLKLHKRINRLVVFAHSNITPTKMTILNSGLLSKLIDETLQTLALLLPSTDRRSSKWFQEKQKRLKLDSQAGRYGHLNSVGRQINNCRYWRDRLVIFKQAFDDTEPRTCPNGGTMIEKEFNGIYFG
jgi:hypothetical protein